jgi:nitrous oxide reductase accessory protein NosL
MIISDERFATGLVTHDERGRSMALAFDDFNCQVSYESAHAQMPVMGRWVHDYASSKWMDGESAWYVEAEGLRTPMASNMAACATRREAHALGESTGGRVLSREEAWEALATRVSKPRP